jgi:DNA-directed RNA polymerase beta' subunit
MSKLNEAIITRIKFSPYTEENIKGDAAARITSKEGYKGDVPTPGGISDPKMGAVDYNWVCDSCQQKNGKCPGHLGYIQLNYPYLNPLFKDIVIKWLKIICFSCGNILDMTLDDIKKNKLDFDKVVKHITSKNTKIANCLFCKEAHPQIKKIKKGDIRVMIEYPSENVIDLKKNTEKQLMNHYIKCIMEKISDDLVIALKELKIVIQDIMLVMYYQYYLILADLILKKARVKEKIMVLHLQFVKLLNTMKVLHLLLFQLAYLISKT